MRAILGSYDSELTPAEYSPQLTRRMREAEDMVQKVHAHSSEMEVSARAPRGLQPPSLSVCAFSLFCPRGCAFISLPPPASAPPSSVASLSSHPSHPGSRSCSRRVARLRLSGASSERCGLGPTLPALQPQWVWLCASETMDRAGGGGLGVGAGFSRGATPSPSS